MTEKRLFRREHPILLGFVILGGIFLVFWAGVTFFLWSLGRPGPEFLHRAPGVGVVEIIGPIIEADAILEDLRDLADDDRVRAVVLRIDSPGGAVGASQEIFTEVARINTDKPVVASLASLAASGGYYAALGAQRIVANPGTLTGSIGVIVKFADLSDLFAKIGYRAEVVKSGRLKDLGAPDRPLTDEERAVLQSLIDEVHEQFITAVAESRGLDPAAVRTLADGRVFSGQQAKALGLIDELGNFTDAVYLAADLAGLPQDEAPELYYPPAPALSWTDLLASRLAEGLASLAARAPVPAYLWSGR